MHFFNFLKKYWLVFILLTIAYVCFILSETNLTIEYEVDTVTEGIYFFACLIGYIIIRKLKIPILDMGWGLLTVGLFIDFFDEFMHEPNIIITGLEGTIATIGLALTAIGFYRAFTKLEKTEQSMRAEHKLLQTLMDNIPDSIYFKDNKDRFVRVNKAKAEHHSTNPEDMIGKTDFDLFPENEAKECFADDNKIMKTGKPIKGKIEELTYKDGAQRWLSVVKIPWYNEKNEIIGTMGISHDITERKKIEEKLRELAIKDSLTDLYNYRHFYQKLKEQINRSGRYKEVYSLIYLDIDNFKACNDTYGHLEGDKVLKILSEILEFHLRKTDSAYRYGGEEFVIMLPHTYKEQVKQVAERIREEVHRKLYPKYKITISAGISDSKTSKDVIKAADMAMYEAKREGKNKVKVV